MNLILIRFVALLIASNVLGANVIDLPNPFWLTHRMENESVLFIKSDGGPATASLWFQPDKIYSIRSATLGVTYQLGLDLVFKNERFELTPKSRIPFLTMTELYEVKNYRNAFYKIWQPTAAIVPLRRAGSFFAERQIEITYDFKTNKPIIPSFSHSGLPRALGRLNGCEPFKFILIGDSIAQGFDSSGIFNFGPKRPSFGETVASWLRSRFIGPINFINWSVEGTTSSYGLERAHEVARENPDLVIIAFGMNDHVQLSTIHFIENINKLIRIIQQDSSHTEIILVTTSLPHPEDKSFKISRLQEYRIALLGLESTRIAIADVTEIWNSMLRKKRHWDVTGNGLNHPNDFGHQLYALTVLNRLIPLSGQVSWRENRSSRCFIRKNGVLQKSKRDH